MIGLLCLSFLVSCTAGKQDIKRDHEYRYGRAAIEAMDIRKVEQNGYQLEVSLTARLPDACTQLDQVILNRDKTGINILLTTRRPAERMCAQVVRQVQKNILIDIPPDAASPYTVSAQGQSRRVIIQ